MIEANTKWIKTTESATMSPRPDAPFKDDLDLTLDHALHMLVRGAADRKAPFHTPTFATQGGLYGVDARVVTLREFSPDKRTLRFHSDVRTEKHAHLGGSDQAVLVFYDPAARVQLRTYGTGITHPDGDVADRAWANSQHFSRRCYMAPSGPGSMSDAPTSGLPADVEGRVPTEEETLTGRPNFSAILLTVSSLDWLFLAHDGHRRARFSWDDAGICTKQWLVP